MIHNAPCFIAGTEVSLEGGDSKNIEDVIPGDRVITYNHESETFEVKTVITVLQKLVNKVIEYTLSNGTLLTGTEDHPIYIKEKGYASFNPILTLEDSSLEVKQVEVGDEVLTEHTESVTITNIEEIEGEVLVYNLDNVKDNHNFLANSVVVHNRAPILK